MANNIQEVRNSLVMAIATSAVLLGSFLDNVASASQWTIDTLPGYPEGKLGYVGVGDMEEVQSFYYFIESERDPRNDPLLLWLTGGPGCSALSGLIFEIGPLAFNYTDLYEGYLPTFQRNPYSWTKWLVRHPEYLENELYIAGDSYSGLPVPMVVELIVNGNEIGLKPLMNIKGYVLGNPYTDANHDCNARVKFAHRVSLISDKLYQSAVLYCDGKYVNVDPNNAQCQKCIFHGLYMPHVLEPKCATSSPKPTNVLQWDLSHYISGEETNLFNLKRRRSNLQAELPELWCRNYNYIPIYAWANAKLVREALHIREGSIEEWVRCNKTFSGFAIDLNNTVPNHQRLTQHFLRALVYSGDQDLAIPYVGTLEWTKSLLLPGTISWRPWFVDGQVAGYITKYSNLKYRLTYTTIKGGGHTALEYKPKEALSMIHKWLS